MFLSCVNDAYDEALFRVPCVRVLLLRHPHRPFMDFKYSYVSLITHTSGPSQMM